jgi:hypothetical protein
MTTAEHPKPEPPKETPFSISAFQHFSISPELSPQVHYTPMPELLHELCAIPGVWDVVTNDKHPADPTGLNWAAICRSTATFSLAVTMGPRLCGGFWFHPQDPRTLSGHVLLFPPCRGKAAVQAGRQVLQWVKEHTLFERVIAHCPANNRPVNWYVAAVGFRARRRYHKAWPKHGQLYDVLEFEYRLVDGKE